MWLAIAQASHEPAVPGEFFGRDGDCLVATELLVILLGRFAEFGGGHFPVGLGGLLSFHIALQDYVHFIRFGRFVQGAFGIVAWR
jgi:hypothetical protein